MSLLLSKAAAMRAGACRAMMPHPQLSDSHPLGSWPRQGAGWHLDTEKRALWGQSTGLLVQSWEQGKALRCFCGHKRDTWFMGSVGTGGGEREGGAAKVALMSPR